MSEADFCGMDAGEYYATKGFLDRERFYRKQEMEEQMKNRVTVRHGMLSDLQNIPEAKRMEARRACWRIRGSEGAEPELSAPAVSPRPRRTRCRVQH